jgi:hypothetical protein
MSASGRLVLFVRLPYLTALLTPFPLQDCTCISNDDWSDGVSTATSKVDVEFLPGRKYFAVVYTLYPKVANGATLGSDLMVAVLYSAGPFIRECCCADAQGLQGFIASWEELPVWCQCAGLACLYT